MEGVKCAMGDKNFHENFPLSSPTKECAPVQPQNSWSCLIARITDVVREELDPLVTQLHTKVSNSCTVYSTVITHT